MASQPAQMLPKDASARVQAMAQAAWDAGQGLLTAAAKRDFTITQKTAGDFVSQADIAAEQLIQNQLKDAYPTYGWLGEEGGAQGDTALRWIVDPLDGTTNFLKGLSHWAVSIALCQGDDTLCAVIHDPTKNETFSAERGQGAYLNDARIAVSPTGDLQEALFATGVPAGGRSAYLPHCLRDLNHLMPQCAGIRRGGAAALDLAYVAAGRLEGYWERNLGPWDIAAGLLLVTEAGGQVAPLWPSQPMLASGSFIASNGLLHDALTASLDSTQIVDGA